MKLDFIEIGTSNFGTLIQNCKPYEFGISVEPISYYLNILPNRTNVIKINKAVTGDIVHDGYMDIYYIPEDVIIMNNLNSWFKGCNRVGGYHPLHILHNVKHLVKKERVSIIYIGDLFKQYNIEHVKFLKIDTEGYDTNIMKGLYTYLNLIPAESHPDKIQFETNENSVPEEVDEIIELYKNINYKVIERSYDTIIEKGMSS